MNSSPQVAALIANINLSNNGYLVIDYMTDAYRKFVVQCAQSGIVKITNGTAHLPVVKPEFMQEPYPTKAFGLRHDGPDYEGEILSRQENQGFYD